MSNAGPTTIAALAQLVKGQGQIELAISEFFQACNRFDWVVAEEKRLAAIACMEAGMDQVMMAYRGLEKARGIR